MSGITFNWGALCRTLRGLCHSPESPVESPVRPLVTGILVGEDGDVKAVLDGADGREAFAQMMNETVEWNTITRTPTKRAHLYRLTPAGMFVRGDGEITWRPVSGAPHHPPTQGT